MNLFAEFTISGVVKQVRELTSEKNKEWRGYVATVQTLGHTFELNLDHAQYQGITVGSLYVFKGEFDEFAGRTKFICKTVVTDLPASVAPARKSA